MSKRFKYVTFIICILVVISTLVLIILWRRGKYYRNEIFGFEINYPSKCQVIENPQDLGIAYSKSVSSLIVRDYEDHSFRIVTFLAGGRTTRTYDEPLEIFICKYNQSEFKDDFIERLKTWNKNVERRKIKVGTLDGYIIHHDGGGSHQWGASLSLTIPTPQGIYEIRATESWEEFNFHQMDGEEFERYLLSYFQSFRLLK